MKSLITSFLLSFQFFTSFPIRKTYEMNTKTVTGMFMWLPIVSLLMGLTNTFILYVNEHYFNFSTLFLAVILVISGIIMTGGLHLDGWIDMSDAYFSYRDKQRRLEILSDPRIGAFGAIGLVVIILLKVAIYNEVLMIDQMSCVIYFIGIPIISRLGMLFYFITSRNAKNEGLAVYFKAQANHISIACIIGFFTILLIIGSIYINSFIIIYLLLLAVPFLLLYYYWTKKNFGGVTGDLLGALYEGLEVYLWGCLLFFI